ncbi:GNAT family N-acetyltransferase [Marinifilum fragile]|uniref:GNAT family N-acetyltransferase n=1 Tax=Marinifilum fragile TaxID=570161 RepID=UPI002AAC3998|nr:GNAT family N-acetyltransferase [Marinifilum fragile]
MNNQVINNLYELWEQIGNITNRISKTNSYTAVSMVDSDWPNRIFNLENNAETLSEIVQLSRKGNAPEMITIPKPNGLSGNPNLEFVMAQKNMALDLKLFSSAAITNPNIKQVVTEENAISFAETASKSFGYKVDDQVINEIIKNSKNIRLFTYQEDKESLGCGIVFFDSRNNAGLHMIGTLPKGRGKGIGENMTEHLLMEAKENNAKICVLHASKMGEPIYTKLGFKTYGELETYKILKERNN